MRLRHRIVARGGSTLDSLILRFYLVTTCWFLATTSLPAHRQWAAISTVRYALALGSTLIRRTRPYAPAIALVGSVFLPLGWLVVIREFQPEVRVVIEGASSLLATGSPYLPDP